MPTLTCSIDGCARPAVAKGLCGMHYQRQRKTGSTDDPPKREPLICSVEGCDDQANVPGSARGWCQKHYARWQATGDPMLTRQDLRPTLRCEVEGCDRKYLASGLCSLHYERLRRTGSTDDPPPRATAEERFLTLVAAPDENGCRVWLGERDKDGYGIFAYTPSRGSKQRNVRAHRWAYEHSIGPIPAGKMVLHSCDNPPCCESTHLRTGTGSDNVQDALSRDRWNPPRGTANPRAVLNEDMVRVIRWLHAERGLGARRLSRILNVSQGAIQGVLSGNNWRHVI